MDLHVKDKSVFISGSTSGIGFATARILLKEGTQVVIHGRSQESVNQAKERLKQDFPGTRIDGFAADFGKKIEVDKLLDAIPSMDILINNIGIYRAEPFLEMKDEDWFRQFEVNVMSGVRLSRHFLPKMLKQDWGRILFVSSECASLVPPDLLAYSATKTAVLAISRGLAQMTKGTKVTVNAVLPGSTRSEGAEQFIEIEAQKSGRTKNEVEADFFKEVRSSSLIQRFATVEEIANTITYLCSPLSAATNGASIKIDGGSTGGIF